jgi:hypothetical protein
VKKNGIRVPGGLVRSSHGSTMTTRKT